MQVRRVPLQLVRLCDMAWPGPRASVAEHPRQQLRSGGRAWPPTRPTTARAARPSPPAATPPVGLDEPRADQPFVEVRLAPHQQPRGPRHHPAPVSRPTPRWGGPAPLRRWWCGATRAAPSRGSPVAFHLSVSEQRVELYAFTVRGADVQRSGATTLGSGPLPSLRPSPQGHEAGQRTPCWQPCTPLPRLHQPVLDASAPPCSLCSRRWWPTA